MLVRVFFFACFLSMTLAALQIPLYPLGYNYYADLYIRGATIPVIVSGLSYRDRVLTFVPLPSGGHRKPEAHSPKFIDDKLPSYRHDLVDL